MTRPAPLLVLVAAGPAAPGAADVLERAAAELRSGRPVEVLLTADGLAWGADARLAALRRAGADAGVCSASARDRGWTAERTPGSLRWSSVTAFLRDVAAKDLWTVFP
jgi:hypothetical protein